MSDQTTNVVDPRREAVATYLLAEVEVYCSSRDCALRRAGEIIAAIDTADGADLSDERGMERASAVSVRSVDAESLGAALYQAFRRAAKSNGPSRGALVSGDKREVLIDGTFDLVKIAEKALKRADRPQEPRGG